MIPETFQEPTTFADIILRFPANTRSVRFKFAAYCRTYFTYYLIPDIRPTSKVLAMTLNLEEDPCLPLHGTPVIWLKNETLRKTVNTNPFTIIIYSNSCNHLYLACKGGVPTKEGGKHATNQLGRLPGKGILDEPS